MQRQGVAGPGDTWVATTVTHSNAMELPSKVSPDAVTQFRFGKALLKTMKSMGDQVPEVG